MSVWGHSGGARGRARSTKGLQLRSRLRLWSGMELRGWMRLLRGNRFAVGPGHLHWLVLITASAVGNTLLRYLQDLLWAKKIREARLVDAPLFVIGHWRSGTSLLHELLALDPAHAFPTTYECFFPNHFLLTESRLSRLFGLLIPSQRPMDNMPMSSDGPLEDEYALCNLGQPSPYLTIAFPNEGSRYQEYLDLASIPREALESWQRSLLQFLKQISLRSPRRIVLKSPPHTCRIEALLEIFPEARFVHVVRDPYKVFASTMNLWRSLYRVQGLQTPSFEGLEEYVFDSYLHMFDRLERTRHLVAPERFYELRYEDLVNDPPTELRKLYEHLGLGEFERVAPKLRQYLQDTAGYQTNRYELSPPLREEIARRWDPAIRRYGYA